ncbi:DUF397 domain-containing protein [Streptomyces sp. NBC_00846]|uniref:DUF397 domain-containing protein n=1 Tax=Streptomyces sp. NBC_00846 TaxID=2975849 RepID=UPI00386BEE32
MSWSTGSGRSCSRQEEVTTALAPELGHVAWRTSSYSGGGSSGGDCVEVAALPTGTAVRDSKNPAGPALRFGDRTWAVFLAEAKRAR